MRLSTSEYPVYCPYCGESITFVVDCSIEQQQYTEDCYVCCRPILLQIHLDDTGEPTVYACQENE